MGNLATSGGYYLSCNADRIFAEPTTITGSIGVFGIIPNISKLANSIGINAEQVSTNKGAKYSVFEPMTEDFYNVTKEGVEIVYSTFVNKVAEGRNMTFDQVDEIAQGRVWTGKQALENGLVDEVKALYDDKINSQSIQAIGYKELYEYFDNKISLKEAIELIKRNSRRYAKKQYTWFNNQMNMKWFEVNYNNFNKTVEEVVNYIKE